MEETITLKDGSQALLRDLKTDEDIQKITDYINALVDEKTFISINEKQTLESEMGWYKSTMKDIENNNSVHLVLEHNGKVVSIVNSKRSLWKENGNVEIGIAMLKEYRGEGLGQYLMKQIISETKKRMNPKRIYLYVFASNEIGIHIYEKLGFVKFATFPKWVNHNGEMIDKYAMELRE